MLSVNSRISASFAAPCESTKIHAFEVEHHGVYGLVVSRHELADPLLERVGGCEEEASVETHDDDAGKRLVIRMLGHVAEHLRSGLAAREGACRGRLRRR